MGDSGVSLDLSHGFNRVVDSWFELFKSEVSTPNATPACAYPGGWTESQIDEARNNSQSTWWSLRWNQSQRATDSMWATRYALVKIEWDLKVQWQTVIWSKADYEHPDEEPPVYDFIDNAVASVELLDSGSLSLTVHAAFGHPTFTDKVAQLPVYFKVQCYDGDTPLRDELRSFLITGDGERQRLG